MIKEFHAIIHRPVEECKHIITHDLRQVCIRWVGSGDLIFKKSGFIDEDEFYIPLPNTMGMGKIIGTVKAIGPDNTEINGELHRSPCFRINFPIAIMMILVFSICTVINRLPMPCLAMFIFVVVPFSIVSGNISCNHADRVYQRPIDAFISTLESGGI
ncbi:MAG: hypothetical protein L0154_15925 [Chloroflexi bacterium]|nr:hypothetical protein [Chloroflexota bacterium]